MDASSHSTTSGPGRPLTVVVAALLLVLAGAVAIVAASSLSSSSKAPHGYSKLARLGVSAKGATLSGRRVRVRISNTRAVQVRLDVIRGRQRKLQGWSAFRLNPGAHTITRRLGKDAPGEALSLRVTARIARITARGVMALKRVGSSPPTQGSSVPSAIALSGSSVAENSPDGTTVGTLSATDPNPAGPLTFSLVAGPGSDDNASFAIDGRTLKTAALLDFEAKPSLAIRVRVADGKGGALERALTIAVTNVDDAPTNIALSRASVAENQPAGSLVGLLSGSDQDPLDTLSFSFAAGSGDADNARFQIAGGLLQTAAVLDFETRSSYTIRLRVSDGNGGTFEQQLTITVTDANDAPTALALAPAHVEERRPAATPVGALTATDEDRPGDTFEFSLVPGAGSGDNGSFQISGRTLQTAAVLDLADGATRTVRVRVSDGRGGTLEQPLTVTVDNVNHAPTAIALTPSTVAENQPGDTLVGALSATDPDAGDTFTFSLVAGAGSADNGSFHVAGSSLGTNAPLDFETKGSYAIRVAVSDGRATFEQQLTVTVTNVNDAPTGIALTSATVAENEPAGTVVGALSTADQDAGASHVYELVGGAGSTDNAQFEISGTSLRTSQSLNFEAGATRSVRIRTTDDGGRTFEKQLQITITDANDAPVATDDSFAGQARAVGNTALVVDDPSDGAPDPNGPQKTVSGNILANDTDQDGSGSLAVVAATLPTNDGGTVDLQSDGDFVFHPAAGTSCADHSDFFDYTVTDQNSTKPPGTPGTGVGRATIEIQDCVWYVDGSAAGGGDGTSRKPFSALAALAGPAGAGDVDSSGDTIFLYGGSYAGGLPLEPAQSLLGQRHGLTVPNGAGGTVTLEPAAAGPGGAPSTVAGGLALAADNTIQGIDLGNAADAALSGTAVGNAVMNTVTPGAIDNQTGGAVSISGGTLTMAFSSVSSNGGTSGIALTNVGGSFTAAGGTLAGAAGDDVALSGGSANVTYDGAISDDVGPLVTISNETAGTKDFNGAISDGGDGDGDGIALTSNTGATIRFRGGLTLATGANPAFSATGGGTLAVTDPAGPAANTIATTTGTALTIANTRIRAGGVTFESVSSSGAPSGIVLSATGNAGGLAVTGTGSAGSGGTITGSTGPGISVTGVAGGADLAWMSVTGGGDDGIRGANVDGFRFADGAVTNNGDAAGESGIDLTALTGTVGLTSNAAANVSMEHNGGTLDATVTGGSYGGNSPTIGTDGILLRGTRDGTMTVNIQNATFANDRRDHVRMTTDATSTVVQHLTVNNATMTSSAGSVGSGIKLNPGGNATADATLTSNTIQGSAGPAIVVDSPGTAAAPQPVSIAATISQNTIGTPGTADSGSRTGDGIAVNSSGGAGVRALVTNNVISQYASAAGVNLAMSNGNGTLDATVRGNTISNPGATASNGVLLRSGSQGGTENTSTCLDLGHPTDGALKNALTGAGIGGTGNTDIRVRQLASTTVKLPGYAGGTPVATAVGAYLRNRNDPVSPPTVSVVGTGYVPAASCVLP
jgi:hypothetical protein